MAPSEPTLARSNVTLPVRVQQLGGAEIARSQKTATRRSVDVNLGAFGARLRQSAVA